MNKWRDDSLRGQSLFILTILVVGLSGLVAQVMLLRELLVSFYGNELTLGVILANWIISEALGVFIIGKIIERIKNKINVFIALQIIFSLLLPLSIYFSRTFKSILGIPFGETIGLNAIFWSSFLIILPLGFCHAGLFSAACEIYSLSVKETERSIGKVYAWETIGAIFGGIILTYLLIPYLTSLQIAFVISLANLIICIYLYRYTPKTKLKYLLLASIALVLYLIFSGGIRLIERISINKQWRQARVLDYRNSIYGNIAVTKQLEQYTFFYNGIPVITAPYPDEQFVEDFGHLPLLFHRNPKQILIISAGAGGLINEILKHPVTKIDYLEIDPLIIKMLKKYPTALTESELQERRVNIINLDGRFFLRTNPSAYDVILIGLSNQSDLSTNRLFTRDFFSLAKKRLNGDGVLALWLPGSLTYLSAELRDLNASILNGLKGVFAYTRIIPGDYNIFLASQSRGIMEVAPSVIQQRKLEQNIEAHILLPSYVEYRLSKYWLDWFTKSLAGATKKTNQDLRPVAVFETLILWNKKFSQVTTHALKLFENLNLRGIAIFILLITVLLFYTFSRRKSKRPAITYSIATTGFFGMLINLILIFSFQVFYGYLYHRIGILISIFMAGTAAGSIFITKRIEKIKNELRLFVGFEALITAFSYVIALIITRFFASMHYASLIFISLFFVSGLLLGLEFPLAAKMYGGEKRQIGETAGIIYSADLIGGWVAGIFGGIVLLPVLGLFNTCMLIVMLKLSSLLLLTLTSRDTR